MRTWRDGKEGYPLPWNDTLDEPYWVTNKGLSGTLPGWWEWQARRSMKDIIPVIDWLGQSSTS